MTESLKKKTASALAWNAFDKVGFQAIAFVVGVITARLLSPKDFGLIGALAIFTLLSNTLIESGFTSALIRRKHNTNEEYTAMLYFNLAISVVLYLILFFSAPLIADYFRMPELCSLARFLFLAIIFNSLGLVQNIILTKELAFKTMTIANMSSVVLSGTITIILVIYGYAYWALAFQQVLQVTFRTIFLWISNPWRISKNPHFRVIKEVFNFSILLLFTSILSTIVRNIYNIIIGKIYSVQDLGYYSQAYKYQQIPSYIISSTQSGVAYPVFSKLNHEPERQLLYLRKIMRITSFLIFPIMIGLFALAKEFVSILLTDKWLPSVPYFRILILSGIVAPFHIIYLNLVTVKGHPKLNFQLEMIRNILVVLSLFLGIGSIERMLYGLTIATVLSYVIDLYFIRKLTGYKIWWQVKDILPYAAISLGMYIVVFGVGVGCASLKIIPRSLIQAGCGAIFYFISLKVLGSKVLEDAMELFNKKSSLKGDVTYPTNL